MIDLIVDRQPRPGKAGIMKERVNLERLGSRQSRCICYGFLVHPFDDDFHLNMNVENKDKFYQPVEVIDDFRPQ